MSNLLKFSALLAVLLSSGCANVKWSATPVSPYGHTGAYMTASIPIGITDTAATTQAPLDKPVLGRKTVSEHVKDTFWDWRNGVESTKSIAMLALATGAGTYAAGMWDEDDIFGGDDDDAQALADALVANSQSKKQVAEVNGQNNKLTIKDLPQDRAVQLSITGAGNDVTIDLQQDTQPDTTITFLDPVDPVDDPVE